MSKVSRIIPDKARRICPIDGDFCRYPCSKLVHARMDAKLSDGEVIKLLGIARNTWWRYRSGSARPPLSVCGYLSCRAGWQRFSINVHNGKLFRDDLRDGFAPEDVASLFWLRQALQHWRSWASRVGQDLK